VHHAAENTPAREPDKLQVLYLYGGGPRRSDLREALLAAMSSMKCTFELGFSEFDIASHPGLDVKGSEEQKKVISAVKEGRWDVIVMSPPTSSFSRAAFTKNSVMVPTRDKTWPGGFPWLQGAAAETTFGRQS
jgi:hypothetical protein